ncbi:hypothetical protein NOCA2290010 [metagenome]|uniref:Uncharacterized protein n=1 Tax=metagenome TaxID=256318 RepID=A0A2P2C0S6_9ZZZZ
MDGIESDRLVIAVHGRLHMEPSVRAMLEDEERGRDPWGMFVTRSVALGLASFRTHATGDQADEDKLYEGTERWSQHDVFGDWGSDEDVRELLAVRVQLNRMNERTHQRLPVQPALSVVRDVLGRVGTTILTGVHADLPLGVAGDSLGDVARGRDWFLSGAGQRPTDLVVTVRLEPGAEATEAATRLVDELSLYAPMIGSVLPTIVVTDWSKALLAEASAFSGRPGASVAEDVLPDDNLPGIAFRCQSVEWNVDVAAWTLELFGEIIRRALSASQASVRVSASGIR